MMVPLISEAHSIYKVGDSPFRKRYCLYQTCNAVLTEHMLLQGRSYCSKKCQRAAAAIRRKVERHADVVKNLRDELRKAQAETRAAQKARDAAKTRAALAIKRKNEFHAFVAKNLKDELREAQADARSAQKASLKATKELRNYLLTCTCGATVGTIS